MIDGLKEKLGDYKYEILLFALITHLYIGIFIPDLDLYTYVVWPINMVFLGIASVGVFVEKTKVKRRFQNVVWIIAFLLPLGILVFGKLDSYMEGISIFYCLFFGFILFEVIRFLIRPGYINRDIISASACGYFLMIEAAVFLYQSFFYFDPMAISNVSTEHPAETYMDLVYFSSISITSIGYGDVTPNSNATRLISSFFGVVSQFYVVVLVGILISKFTNAQTKNL